MNQLASELMGLQDFSMDIMNKKVELTKLSSSLHTKLKPILACPPSTLAPALLRAMNVSHPVGCSLNLIMTTGLRLGACSTGQRKKLKEVITGALSRKGVVFLKTKQN